MAGVRIHPCPYGDGGWWDADHMVSHCGSFTTSWGIEVWTFHCVDCASDGWVQEKFWDGALPAASGLTMHLVEMHGIDLLS